jgi:polyisoprenoid-binding protein YceI
MSTVTPTSAAAAAVVVTGARRLDPTRSHLEFQVRHFYGLMTVKGEFDRYEGTLDLGVPPAVELTIEADSLDTKIAKRDAHLRSADFFDVDDRPQLGMTWSPLGIMRAPSKLIVRGRLVREEAQR